MSFNRHLDFPFEKLALAPDHAEVDGPVLTAQDE